MHKGSLTVSTTSGSVEFCWITVVAKEVVDDDGDDTPLVQGGE